MRHNVSDMNSVFRDLLPPIVPYTMAESSAGRALLRYFSTVVYLISPDIPKDLPFSRGLGAFLTALWRRHIVRLL